MQTGDRRRSLPLRIVVGTIGAALTLAGFVGLFLPVIPGVVLLIPGLALLAGEFVWARRLLDGVRSRVPSPRSNGSGRDAA